MKIAIPSYKRADTLKKKTLRFLQREQIPKEWIHIFVASEEEKVEYQEKIPSELYGQLIVGKPGLPAQRRFIRDWFSENEILCELDDDVTAIRSLENQSFQTILDRAKGELEKGCGLFGVLPNADGRRFKNDTTYHLTHILGAFFVIRNHKDIEIETAFKEDFERSILYFKKYGKVARYRGAGVETVFQGGTGGLQCADRQQKVDCEIEDLITKYPKYIRVVEKPKRKDIILNWRSVA